MGCSSPVIKESIFDPLQITITKLEVDSIDKVFAEAVELLKDIEDFRQDVVKNWGTLLYDSGAIVLLNPTYNSVIRGLCFVVARDLGNDPLKYVDIRKENPWVTIKDGFKVPQTLTAIQKGMCDYAETGNAAINELNYLCEKTQDLLTLIVANFQSYLEICMEKVQGDFMKLKPYAEKLNDNRKKIEKALSVVIVLLDMCKSISIDSQNFLNSMKEEIKRKEIFDLLKKVNIEAKNDSANRDERKLYYNFTTEEKYDNWEKWFPVYEKIKNEVSPGGNQKNGNQAPGTTGRNSALRKSVLGKYDPVHRMSKNIRASILNNLSPNKKMPNTRESANVPPQMNLSNDVVKSLEEKIDKLMATNAKFEKELTDLKQDKDKKAVNVYVNKMFPLKSWNMCLAKSFQLQDISTFAKSLCINYEQDMLCIGTKKGKIEVYKTTSWTFQFALFQHSDSVKTLCYLCDGASVVSGGKDGKIIKWDLTNQTGILFEPQLQFPVKSIVHPLNGKTIYVASGKNVHTYDLLTGKEDPNALFGFEFEVERLLWVPNNKVLAIGLRNGMVNIYNPDKKDKLIEYEDHSQKVVDLVLCRINSIQAVASFSKDKTYKLYDPSEDNILKAFSAPNKTTFAARAGVYCNDEKSILTIHDDGKIFLNNYLNESTPGEHNYKYYFSKDEKLTCAIYLGDGNTFVIANNKGSIDIFYAK